MFSYDKPLIVTYPFSAIAWKTTNVTRLLATPMMPVNRRRPAGKVLGATVHNITEDFAGTTVDARLEVGISGDTDKYFKSAALDETVDIGESLFLVNDTANAAVDIEPGRTDITVTFIASTGTPTGVADCALTIMWW